MIKVNYDQTTGKVISFGMDKEPYIEITEEERKQPLPDRYSYYAVVDGKFTIQRRSPSQEELNKDSAQARALQIAALKRNLNETDYQAIKFAEGWITAEEYASVKAQRAEWRKQINELEESNGNSENS